MRIPLVGYEPPPASDPWTKLVLERSDASTGPWTEVGTVTLSPVDSDPASPQVRNVDIEDPAATETSWFRIHFENADGDTSMPSTPVSAVHRVTYLPGVSQIGSLLRARTKTDAGELGTFTAATRPTSAQVRDHIREASNDVASVLGYNVPPNVHETARSLVALGTALTIELSYFPEQVQSNRSPYAQLKALYDERMARAVEAVAESVDDNEVDVDSDGMPSFGGFDLDNITTVDGPW